MDFQSLQRKWLTQMLDREDIADVVVLVGPDEIRVPAVRALLANISEPFRAILESQGVAKLPQVSLEAFRCIQRAAYGLDPELSAENCAQTYCACQLYEVKELAAECQRYLTQDVKPQDVLKAYSECLGHQCRLDFAVEVNFWRLILFYPHEVLTCTAFLHAHVDIIKRLVMLEEFGVDEATLWTRLIEWAKVVASESHVEAGETLEATSMLSSEEYAVLRTVIPYIRMPCIEKPFFVDKVAPYLSRVEAESVLVHHLLGRKTEFSHSKRTGKPPDLQMQYEIQGASHDANLACELPKGLGGWQISRHCSNTFTIVIRSLHSSTAEVTLSKVELETYVKGYSGDSSNLALLNTTVSAYSREANEYVKISQLGAIGPGKSVHTVDKRVAASSWQITFGTYSDDLGQVTNGSAQVYDVAKIPVL
eukprot:CAMPEP_0169382842 /NCGR_PEP_ID=MMETSP1017-20121227/42301_1 /TAXON_ID=342587 /ORGANISM="Karlodinium micrum, Strain CCMP2283" /LENGTH=421 /DNA_ID=CAMNT_0009482743 /DNA_START=33 /DNA_END=1294 /DNA_ORIENTATION=-